MTQAPFPRQPEDAIVKNPGSFLRASVTPSIVGLLFAVLISFLTVSTAMAQDSGYHARFEAECGRCHGHSGGFSRDRLEIVDGQLVGRERGRLVERFLQRHPGGLTPADITLFRDVMYRQVEAGGLFREQCAICHGRAVELAAANLGITDGVLLIRYDRTPVRDFLTIHGPLNEREIEIVYRALYEITDGR